MDLAEKLKNLLKSNLIDWINLKVKSNVDYNLYSDFINSDLTLNSNYFQKALEFQYLKNDKNKSQFNYIKGFLSEYLPLQNRGVILNESVYLEKFNKYFFLFQNMPLELKNYIQKSINQINKEFDANESIPPKTFWILYSNNNALDPFTSKIFKQYEINYHSFASQSDLIFLNNENQWKAISLKTTQGKFKGFGLKNTSPKRIDPFISDYIKKLEEDFWNEFPEYKTQKERKNFLKNNNLRDQANNFWINNIAPKILNRLILALDEKNNNEVHNLMEEILDVNPSILLGSTKEKTYSNNLKNVVDFIKSLKFEKINLKQISNTTFSLNNELIFRIKYSNGNLCSSLKMQIDYI